MTEETQAAEPNAQVSPETLTDDNPTQATEPTSEQPENKESAPLEKPIADDANDGFQKRINKVTADKHTERRRADSLQTEVDELKRQQPKKQELPNQPPVAEDFDFDDDKLRKAEIDFAIQKNNKELQARHKQENAHLESQKIQSEYDTKRVEFEKKTPDFQEVIKNIPAFPQETFDLIMSADNGPALVYHLGQRLDVADEVASLSPMNAALLLGKISSNLSDATKNIKTTSAPEPIQTLEGSGEMPKDYSQMSQAEICNLPP